MEVGSVDCEAAAGGGQTEVTSLSLSVSSRAWGQEAGGEQCVTLIPSQSHTTTTMPASEIIDDIFASKPKTKETKSKTPSRKRSNHPPQHRPKKRQKIDGQYSARPRKSSPDDRFKDSRGTGSRRKTEEGYSIYKEDELGIGNEGGDTPQCPFDCNCCF